MKLVEPDYAIGYKKDVSGGRFQLRLEKIERLNIFVFVLETLVTELRFEVQVA